MDNAKRHAIYEALNDHISELHRLEDGGEYDMGMAVISADFLMEKIEAIFGDEEDEA